MAVNSTVVFADLTGSTGVFEALGNAKATEAITRLTQWISQVCESHHGRVVKTLGDGVLAVFPMEADAVNAVVELQRNHLKRILNWPPKLRMRLQVGVACGEIVEVDGDCYGDAVNVASRLSDLSGADQIWASRGIHGGLPVHEAIRVSWQSKMPVFRIIGERLPQTLTVVGTAYLIGILIALPIMLRKQRDRFSELKAEARPQASEGGGKTLRRSARGARLW